MPLFKTIELPFCKIIAIDHWNSPAHRYFISYRAVGSFRHVLGLPVIDEFATFSSPIFFAPIPLMGKIYNAGITLAHKIDPELPIDAGWPPLCIGMEGHVPALPSDFEAQILNAIQRFNPPPAPGHYTIDKAKIGQTTVFATNAPLLPRQLRRICERAKTPFAVAFSTANRITAAKNAAPLSVNVMSERSFQKLL